MNETRPSEAKAIIYMPTLTNVKRTSQLINYV